MAYQSLNGVQITPKGTYNTARFSKSFSGSSWPTSYGWGGWIYNSSCDIGFSSAPNEIRLSIVLEAGDKEQMAATFDINNEDLRIDAGDGGDENLYDIDLNGVPFLNCVLYSYEISIEANTKILNVVLKDYSVILDKIYVGLLKRQGDEFIHSVSSTVSFPANCPDCLLDGSSFINYGSVQRDISYGSYVGINGKTYDNFEGLPETQNIYSRWSALFGSTPSNVKFDLNGGFLLLGTEDVSEEKCGNLGDISYTFNQLLASLKKRGMTFSGAFPKEINESNFNYKQNYIGTLREVLQQWCSDLGLDFYCNSKEFIGLNVSNPLNIQKIAEISDPTTDFGSEFAINKDTAILSYKENNTLENSYLQSVITANNQPRQTKTHSKTIKRYVGLLPLHPIDFLAPSSRFTYRFDIFGNQYSDAALINSFGLDGDLDKRLDILDGRTYRDIDTSIALTRHDADLRDIYCQEIALDMGELPSVRNANFRALGMYPLAKVTNKSDKSLAIESAYGGRGDEVSNICLDESFYEVYIGYYYPKLKEEIVRWEQAAGDAMYRYGAIVKGLWQRPPYTPPNVTNDISPSAGLYGSKGKSSLRVRHTYEPDCKQYMDLDKAPFKDLILYRESINKDTEFNRSVYVGEISNEWGTTVEDFKRKMSLNLDDQCVSEFAQDPSYTEMANSREKKFQDWNLSHFKPKAISDLSQFFDFYLPILKSLGNATDIDRTVQTYYDKNSEVTQSCSKLHILVLTKTDIHPNINVIFKKQERIYTNEIMLQKYRERQREIAEKKADQKTPSVCEKSLLQEMCDSLVTASGAAYPLDSRFGCFNEKQSENYEEGFGYDFLATPNSRGLEVSIIKNPHHSKPFQSLYNTSDANGAFYYMDLAAGELSMTQRSLSYTIVYPISTDMILNTYYSGIMTSNVEVENRSPEIVEVFGTPVNSKNNRTAGIKVLNNSVDPDLSPQLDPLSSRFISYLTVLNQDNKTLSSVKEYHDFVKNLNSYQVTGVNKSIELSLAGDPNHFGSFKNYISPAYGLTKMSIGVTDNGVVTSLSYSDRPPMPPKQESILNKISPRII